MNWASSIPLVSLIVVVFGAGLIVSEVRALRKEVNALAERHDKSAASQGRRIGNIESYLGLNADGIPVERLSRAHMANDDDGRVR
jgi:hypothetical protein